VAGYVYLTDAAARTLTRGKLVERIEAQQQWYQAKRRKTNADHAAMRELGRILRRYVDLGAAFDATIATVTGAQRGVSYWDTRPADDPAEAPP
jgi:hypothetical protein